MEKNRNEKLAIEEVNLDIHPQTNKSPRECKVRWHTTFDSIKDSIFLLDLNGKIIKANKSSQSLFEKKLELIVGRYCYQVIHEKSDFCENCPFVRMKISRQREDMVLEVNEKWYDIIVDPILDSNNELIGAVHNVTDITHRKTSELIIQQQNQQLKELNTAKDKFFSIISHDLRSPFQNFISLTEMLAEGIGDFSNSEISELSKKMNNNAKGLLKLLSNLLDWTRMQQGITSFDPTEINLSEAVYQNINLLTQSGEKKDIDLISTIPKNQKVYADYEMLNGILRNLLSNSVKFTNKGGSVTITCKEIKNNFLQISVNDNGVGMSTDLCNKLFKIEEKVGRIGTNGEISTGLGLLLCKEYVEKHRGKIWVDSKINIGSSFHFTLPTVTKGEYM